MGEKNYKYKYITVYFLDNYDTNRISTGNTANTLHNDSPNGKLWGQNRLINKKSEKHKVG